MDLTENSDSLVVPKTFKKKQLQFKNSIDHSFKEKMDQNIISESHVDKTPRTDWLKINYLEDIDHQSIFQGLE